ARRDLLDQGVNLAHAFGVADHISERPILAKLAAEQFVLAPRAAVLCRFSEHQLKPSHVYRLFKIVKCAFVFDRTYRRINRPLPCEQYHGGVGIILSELSKQPEPVQVRHNNVRDDYHRGEALYAIKRLTAI